MFGTTTGLTFGAHATGDGPLFGADLGIEAGIRQTSGSRWIAPILGAGIDGPYGDKAMGWAGVEVGYGFVGVNAALVVASKAAGLLGARLRLLVGGEHVGAYLGARALWNGGNGSGTPELGLFLRASFGVSD